MADMIDTNAQYFPPNTLKMSPLSDHYTHKSGEITFIFPWRGTAKGFPWVVPVQSQGKLSSHLFVQ